MHPTSFSMERGVARCRVFLSLIAILALFVDPGEPALTHWLPLTNSAFALKRYWATVLCAHLIYSVSVYWLQVRVETSSPRLTAASTLGDILFATAIALVTEGTTSPFYSFFTFAVVATGLRSGLRATLLVTGLSVGLYIILLLGTATSTQAYYIAMRATYIAIAGYLVGYLGQERINQDERIRALEAVAQREGIARSLHDGYSQALAGVNLRLATCQELLRRGQQEDALKGLAELQSGVGREYDQLRAYIRTLIEREGPAHTPRQANSGPVVSVRVFMEGSPELSEHTLLIAVEAIRNACRHAQATRAALRADMDDDGVVLTIEDDGVGFPSDAAAPWSIASRVSECGGELRFESRTRGAYMQIHLPES